MPGFQKYTPNKGGGFGFWESAGLFPPPTTKPIPDGCFAAGSSVHWAPKDPDAEDGEAEEEMFFVFFSAGSA